MIKFGHYSLNTKQTDRQTFGLKYLFFCICISLLLASCGKDTEKSEAIQLLNDGNIDEFTVNFAHDYFNTLDSLVTAYSSYKQANDSRGFIEFRNGEWTRGYIDKKHYYQAVLELNSPYISQTSIKPLFDKFEKLIYIGLSLKHSLLNDSEAQSQKTLTTIKEDKKIVNSVIKSAGVEAKL